jgi:hypothetical protein
MWHMNAYIMQMNPECNCDLISLKMFVSADHLSPGQEVFFDFSKLEGVLSCGYCFG